MPAVFPPDAIRDDRPRLLVSVRNAEEALAAVAGGADIIDVKEPLNGPLGRAETAVIADIAAAMDAFIRATGARVSTQVGATSSLRSPLLRCGGEGQGEGDDRSRAWNLLTAGLTNREELARYPENMPPLLNPLPRGGGEGTKPGAGALPFSPHSHPGGLSAALGELQDLPEPDELHAIGRCVRWVKVGLSGLRESDWRSRWLALRDELRRSSPHAELIAVVYADRTACDAPSPEDIIDAALDSDSPGILFDTHGKDGRTLTDHVLCGELAGYIRTIHAAGRFVALAGSLGLRQVDELLGLEPDILAVRSAVCAGGRTGQVDASRVAEFRAAMRPHFS